MLGKQDPFILFRGCKKIATFHKCYPHIRTHLIYTTNNKTYVLNDNNFPVVILIKPALNERINNYSCFNC
nr:MAG TPA: hypothetical protein [Caudoviricetes sp.]